METGDHETTKLGQRGALVIPAPLRRLYGLETGCLLIAKALEEGILLRPAKAIPTLPPIDRLSNEELD